MQTCRCDSEDICTRLLLLFFTFASDGCEKAPSRASNRKASGRWIRARGSACTCLPLWELRYKSMCTVSPHKETLPSIPEVTIVLPLGISFPSTRYSHLSILRLVVSKPNANTWSSARTSGIEPTNYMSKSGLLSRSCCEGITSLCVRYRFRRFPEDIRFHSLYRFFGRFCSNMAIVSSSMPAEPRSAFTCWYASHTVRFAILKRLRRCHVIHPRIAGW